MDTVSASRLIVPLVLLAALTSFGQPAWAQLDSREAIALQNQILDLRRQVQTLQDQSARGGSPTYLGRGAAPPPASNDLVAQLLARVDTLEEQVRQLRGRIDETANQVQRQGADLSKRIDDTAFQTQNPQGSSQGGGPNPASTAHQSAIGPPAEFPRRTAITASGSGPACRIGAPHARTGDAGG